MVDNGEVVVCVRAAGGAVQGSPVRVRVVGSLCGAYMRGDAAACIALVAAGAHPGRPNDQGTRRGVACGCVGCVCTAAMVGASATCIRG